MEYKAIHLQGNSEGEIKHSDVDELNSWFAAGWEYVESISQRVAIFGGDYAKSKYGPIIVILKKETNTSLS